MICSYLLLQKHFWHTYTEYVGISVYYLNSMYIKNILGHPSDHVQIHLIASILYNIISYVQSGSLLPLSLHIISALLLSTGYAIFLRMSVLFYLQIIEEGPITVAPPETVKQF